MSQGTNYNAFCADYSNVANCLFAIQARQDSGAFADYPVILKLLAGLEQDVLRKLYNRTTGLIGMLSGIGQQTFLLGDFSEYDFSSEDFNVGYIDTTNDSYSATFQTVLNMFTELCSRSVELSVADRQQLNTAFVAFLDAVDLLEDELDAVGLNPCAQSPVYNNSQSLFLQAAGSDGSNGVATGIHLRWALAGQLANHLPKGDLFIAVGTINWSNLENADPYTDNNLIGKDNGNTLFNPVTTASGTSMVLPGHTVVFEQYVEVASTGINPTITLIVKRNSVIVYNQTIPATPGATQQFVEIVPEGAYYDIISTSAATPVVVPASIVWSSTENSNPYVDNNLIGKDNGDTLFNSVVTESGVSTIPIGHTLSLEQYVVFSSPAPNPKITLLIRRKINEYGIWEILFNNTVVALQNASQLFSEVVPEGANYEVTAISKNDDIKQVAVYNNSAITINYGYVHTIGQPTYRSGSILPGQNYITDFEANSANDFFTLNKSVMGVTLLTQNDAYPNRNIWDGNIEPNEFEFPSASTENINFYIYDNQKQFSILNSSSSLLKIGQLDNVNPSIIYDLQPGEIGLTTFADNEGTLSIYTLLDGLYKIQISSGSYSNEYTKNVVNHGGLVPNLFNDTLTTFPEILTSVIVSVDQNPTADAALIAPNPLPTGVIKTGNNYSGASSFYFPETFKAGQNGHISMALSQQDQYSGIIALDYKTGLFSHFQVDIHTERKLINGVFSGYDFEYSDGAGKNVYIMVGTDVIRVGLKLTRVGSNTVVQAQTSTDGFNYVDYTAGFTNISGNPELSIYGLVQDGSAQSGPLGNLYDPCGTGQTL